MLLDTIKIDRGKHCWCVEVTCSRVGHASLPLHLYYFLPFLVLLVTASMKKKNLSHGNIE
jgi:hypothetical protein